MSLVVAVGLAGAAGMLWGPVPPIAAAIAMALIAVVIVGVLLWRADPDRPKVKSNLGTGLLAGFAVSLAIGGAEVAMDEERAKRAERQGLFTTVAAAKDLREFDLRKGDATEFYFVGKNLSYARFGRANLAKANFGGARLEGAEFCSANLRDANLFEADLREATLTGADLGGANVNGADLMRAQLVGAKLPETRLQGVDLVYADLDGAELAGADLRLADLRGAYLGGANLHGAKLVEANLRGAIFNSETTWPTDFHPRAAGARRQSPREARRRTLLGTATDRIRRCERGSTAQSY
jgi:uncharacterized protein YjbI with pentapeptide repeats